MGQRSRRDLLLKIWNFTLAIYRLKQTPGGAALSEGNDPI
jgi:hypothetical protein